MKIVLVATEDSNGGFWAVHRLHMALLLAGIESKLLVLKKNKKGQSIKRAGNQLTARINRLIDSAVSRFYPNRKHVLYTSSFGVDTGIVKVINSVNPDIVHLHWINSGYLSPRKLLNIKAPIVWSHHDMWAFTGGCHYTQGCEKYKVGCGSCPILGSAYCNDVSSLNLKIKLEVYNRLDSLTMIGLSAWMEKCLNESGFTKKNSIVNLPNPICTKQFRPNSKSKGRKYFGIPDDKKIILFGAMSAVSDSRKGFEELVTAINLIPDSMNIAVAVFGAKELPDNFCALSYPLGFLNTPDELVHAYSMSDVMVVPSREENLSNAVMESLSCSTPVVAFDVGGNKDMIDHKRNGYLAAPGDPFDLSAGIVEIITLSQDEYNRYRQAARQKVESTFASPIVARKYIELYNGIAFNE